LELARKHGFDDDVARAFACLGPSACEQYRFAQADSYLNDGIAHCAERDLEFMRLYLMSWKAISLMYQGRWAQATVQAESVLGHSQPSPVHRIMALVALGRLQARQGDPKAAATLDRALELALPIGELQRLGPVRAARAEAAWLAGDRDAVLAEVKDHYEIAVHRKHRWHIGELAFWRWRAGDLAEPPEGIFEPFSLQIAGNWKEATVKWQALGCPYETASALADSHDETDLRYALAEFSRLGAKPMAAVVTKRLRSMGVVTIPRGPRPTTRAHAGGLTLRENDVLRLLAVGLTNTQIADELFLSTRTVEHHVSSILAKLNVESRQAAVEQFQHREEAPTR
jgi:DNA-binding CsgD family transcriptional regulator